MLKSFRLLETLRLKIQSHEFQPGQTLPTLRELAQQYHISTETARQALMKLAAEGLLTTSHQKRFIVQKTIKEKQLIFGFITNKKNHFQDAQKATWACQYALQVECEMKKIPLVTLHLGGSTDQNISAQIQNLNLSAIVTDTNEEKFLQTLISTKIPLITINSWIESLPTNSILQDNMLGGELAANHLLDKGVDEIYYICHQDFSNHSQQRLAGVFNALVKKKKSLSMNQIIFINANTAEKKISTILNKIANKRLGFITIDHLPTKTLFEVAQNKKLTLHQDYEQVGWCVHDYYQTEFKKLFDQKPLPAAMIWQASDMAKATIERLTTMTHSKLTIPLKTLIPITLKRDGF